MHKQSDYLSELTELAIEDINQDESRVFYEIWPKTGIVMLDCRSDYAFKVNNLGYLTYALDNPANTNKKRIESIRTASIANYQRNHEGGWLWDYDEVHYDILNILKEGVSTYETQRDNGSTRVFAYKRNPETGGGSFISDGMGRARDW
jgi:hypothetical protein